MSADMHRGQRASLGNQTDHAIKAGYKDAADFFAPQHKFFLLPGRHPYKFAMPQEAPQIHAVVVLQQFGDRFRLNPTRWPALMNRTPAKSPSV